MTPLLMIGGAFLCLRRLREARARFLHSPEEDAARVAELADALLDAQVDMAALEKDKIKGAIRTDFVLSAEIIAITLGTVATESLVRQFAVLASIAVIMTVGVYGFVAAIVKLDDGGLALTRRADAFSRSVGRAVLAGAPLLMRAAHDRRHRGHVPGRRRHPQSTASRRPITRSRPVAAGAGRGCRHRRRARRCW